MISYRRLRGIVLVLAGLGELLPSPQELRLEPNCEPGDVADGPAVACSMYRGQSSVW